MSASNWCERQGDGGDKDKGKVGTDDDVIELLDSDSEEDEIVVSSTSFRVLNDGCLEILEGDDDSNNKCQTVAASISTSVLGTAKYRKKISTLPGKENLETSVTATKRRITNSNNNASQKALSRKMKTGKNSLPSNYNCRKINDKKEEDDDDVIVALPSSSTFVPAAASMASDPSEGRGEEEEEIQFVGHTGNNALEDFPHCKLLLLLLFIYISVLSDIFSSLLFEFSPNQSIFYSLLLLLLLLLLEPETETNSS